MSAVINKAKQYYRKALLAELVFILLSAVTLSLWQGNIALSWLNGAFVMFIPHVLLVYWVFFRTRVKIQQKMTVLYSGEGMKWLVAILLIVASFKFMPNLSYIAFFSGYFLALVLNVALPMYYSHRVY